MEQQKPINEWSRAEAEVAAQQAEERAYHVDDTEGLEYAERLERERVYQPVTKELTEQRKNLVPKPAEAFKTFSRAVFAEGALPAKLKQLIAVAVAHVTQCPYCIRGHTKAALQAGATREEIMEAIWVAAEMRAGGAYAHSILALDTMAQEHAHEQVAHHPQP